MTDIASYMTTKHRACDELFIEAEKFMAESNWENSIQKWQLFCENMEHHLHAEESVIFPKFEQATGMTSGPTAVMKMEHQQMRSLMSDIGKATEQQNKDTCLGLTETMMILMQQHNMKEEQVLYPMSAKVIPDAEAVLENVRKICE